MRRNRRATLLLSGSLGVVVGVGIWLHSGSAPACGGTAQQVNMRVLVLAASDRDPLVEAWRLQLASEGIPADFQYLHGRPRAPRTLVAPANIGRYHGVIVLPSLAPRQLTQSRDPVPSGLHAALRAHAARSGTRLAHYEAAPWAGAGGQVKTLAATPDGVAAWQYLRGRRPGNSTPGQPSALVTDAAGTPLVSERPAGNGRELVLHRRLAASAVGEPVVRHGVVAWLAGAGPRVGAWQPSLSIHVDDVLLSSDTWDADNDRSSPRRQLRMSPADLRGAARWSERHGMPLDLAINGAGAGGDACEPLLRELHASQKKFRLVNHTFSHRNLDAADARTIESEIQRNVTFARTHGLNLQPGELVTGGHTGLANRRTFEALRRSHTRVVGTDASQIEPAPQAGVSWVPRLPIGLAFDAPTVQLQVDQWRARGYPTCRDGGCDGPPSQVWQKGRRREAEAMLGHVMAGDIRPFYAHQANLTRDATLLDIAALTLQLAGANTLVDMQHPSMTQISVQRRRLHNAVRAFEAGTVTAQRTGRKLRLEATRFVIVPVTMRSASGERIEWVHVRPGNVVTLTDRPTDR